MTGSDVYLLCFGVGFLWSIASLLMGSFRVHGHAAMHGHSHVIHGGHGIHGAHADAPHGGSDAQTHAGGFFEHLLNVNSLAIFLAWFGGCGYLLTQHTEYCVHVQGQGRGRPPDWPRAGRPVCARGQRTQGGQPCSHRRSWVSPEPSFLRHSCDSCTGMSGSLIHSITT